MVLSQGVQLPVMRELASYWATEYDLHRCKARLGALPDFITEIEGLYIHFIHVRSPTRMRCRSSSRTGGQVSVIEMLNVIDPLNNPTAHGASAADAFGRGHPLDTWLRVLRQAAVPRLSPVRLAYAWDVLMKRLGYQRYVAQAGDWGAIITDLIGEPLLEGRRVRGADGNAAANDVWA
jgi:hypothetical protein